MLIIFTEPIKKAKSAAGKLLPLRTIITYNQKYLAKAERSRN